MNVYATNNPEYGFDFNGSFSSYDEASLVALKHGLSYAFWWTDSDEGERPDWTFYTTAP